MLFAAGRTGVPMLLAAGLGAIAARPFLAATFLVFPLAAFAAFFAGAFFVFATFLAAFFATFLVTFLATFLVTFLATFLRAVVLVFPLLLPLPVFFLAAMTANPSVDGLGYRIIGAGMFMTSIF